MSITLWVAGARDLGAARGQLVFATAPFVGAIVAWTVFTDPVTVRDVGSLVIAAVEVSFVLRSDHDHDHAHAPIAHDHEQTHDEWHHDGHQRELGRFSPLPHRSMSNCGPDVANADRR